MSTAYYDFLAVHNNPLKANVIPVGYPEYTPPPQPRDDKEVEIGDLEREIPYPVPRRDESVRERILMHNCGEQMSQMGRAWVKH